MGCIIIMALAEEEVQVEETKKTETPHRFPLDFTLYMCTIQKDYAPRSRIGMLPGWGDDDTLLRSMGER